MKKSEILSRYAALEAQLKDIYSKISAIKEPFEARNWGSSMSADIPWALAAINRKRREYTAERKRFEAMADAEVEALDFTAAFRGKEEEIEGYMSTYRTFKNML